jgi:chitodextrinase
MNNMKNITVLIGITLVSALTISASFAGAAVYRSVYGDVYIDDMLASAGGIEVKITFPINVYTDPTDSVGAYTINIVENNYEEGTFKVYYNGLWYIPTDNQTIELGGSEDLLYNYDLHINTSITPPDTEDPSKVTGLTVTNKKDGKLGLSWTAATDNVAVDVYNIYRDNIYIANTSGTTYSDSGLNNGQQYEYEVEAIDTSDNVGPLSDPAYGTPTASSSGPSGPSGPTSPVDTNQAPVAVINVSDTSVFIGETITFDGTGSYDSDGSVSNWSWNFGDGNSAFGATATHAYSQAGDFTVTLTIKDNQGKLDTETEAISVAKANNPPTVPTIEGPASGTKGTDYTFTVSSTDADNDTIQYITNWDDGETEESEYYENDTSIDLIHSYTTAGKYTITVIANDNETVSGSAQHIIYIDARSVDDIGYLTDDDADGTYDSFHNDTSGQETDVEKQDDGTYLLDDDGDDSWDWIYDIETDTLTKYSEPTPEPDNTALIVLAIIVILFLIILGYLVKRSNDKKKAQKKAAEKKSQPKKNTTGKKSKK